MEDDEDMLSCFPSSDALKFNIFQLPLMGSGRFSRNCGCIYIAVTANLSPPAISSKTSSLSSTSSLRRPRAKTFFMKTQVCFRISRGMKKEIGQAYAAYIRTIFATIKFWYIEYENGFSRKDPFSRFPFPPRQEMSKRLDFLRLLLLLLSPPLPFRADAASVVVVWRSCLVSSISLEKKEEEETFLSRKVTNVPQKANAKPPIAAASHMNFNSVSVSEQPRSFLLLLSNAQTALEKLAILFRVAH